MAAHHTHTNTCAHTHTLQVDLIRKKLMWLDVADRRNELRDHRAVLKDAEARLKELQGQSNEDKRPYKWVCVFVCRGGGR